MSSSSPRKRLLSLLLWAVVLVVIANITVQVTGLYVWQPFTHPFETARIAEAWFTFPDSEILLLGSSLVQNGLNPEAMMKQFETQLGRSLPTYNLAIYGGGVGGMVPFLRAAARGVQPRMIVYGTTQQECRVALGLDRIRFYRAFASPIDVLKGEAGRQYSFSELRLRTSAIFKPLTIPGQAIYQILAEAAARRLGMPETRFERERLQVRSGRGWNPIGGRDIPGSWRYHEVRIDWDALERLHNVARSLSAELVIVHMPEDMNTVPGKADVRETFAGKMEEFCSRRSIPYFDLNRVTFSPRSEEFAADGRHLLGPGAKRLSRNLAREILVPLLQEAN